jgi:hypothetical protein
LTKSLLALFSTLSPVPVSIETVFTDVSQQLLGSVVKIPCYCHLPTTTGTIRCPHYMHAERFRRLASLFSEIAEVLEEEAGVLLEEEEDKDNDK